MKIKLIQTVFLFLSGFLSLIGQNDKPVKLLWMPEKFISPVEQRANSGEFLNQRSANTKTLWVVYSDRANNICRIKPDEGADQQGKSLNFMESAYVVEEQEDWIHIVQLLRGQLPNGNQTKPGQVVMDRGWIQKENLLLWNTALKDEKTKITLKSFILYSYKAAFEVLHGNNNSKAPVFKGPDKTYSKMPEINIYDFYYILKKSGNFYLLATDINVINGIEDSQVIGWVEIIYQAGWNTRLCMEPNFDEEAFKERKSNKNLQVSYYETPNQAKTHAETGFTVNDRYKLSKDDADPVNRKVDKATRRMPGTVMRFPVLNDLTDIKTYFKTGFLGDLNKENAALSQEERATFESEFNNFLEESNNYDILLVVEASVSMQKIKAYLKNSIDRISKELKPPAKPRFAVAFYREPSFGGAKPYFKLLPFTPNIDEVVAYLENENFYSDNIYGYTTMYHAIYQAVLKVGFGKYRTNLVYVIGNNADFSIDAIMDAKCGDCADRVLSEKIEKKLSDFRVNLTFIQPEQKDELMRADFRDESEGILLELAKRNYSSSATFDKIVDKKNPDINETGLSRGKLSIDYSPTSEALYFPVEPENYALSDSRMNDAIIGQLNQIISDQKVIFSKLRSMIQDGQGYDGIASGNYSEAMLFILDRIYKESNLTFDEAEKKALFQKNLQLYIEAYSPMLIKGSNYPLYKPVMFFPITELKDYLEDLKKISSVKQAPSIEKRRAVYDGLVSLFERFAVENKSGTGKREADLNQLRVGLIGNGLQVAGKQNFLLKNIRSERDLPETDLDKFIQNIDNKVILLENIIRGGYKFKYERYGVFYYYIPFEDTF